MPKRRTYTRTTAAAYIAEALGVPFSPRTLETKPVPYKVINGRSIYDEPDLDAHIAQTRGQAVRRIGRARVRTSSETVTA